MRPIEFKGKRTENGDWVHGFYINDVRPIIYCGSCLGHAEQYYVDPKTVGQFTGLHDKNGGKIFEGDRLKSKSNKYYAVEYIDGCFYAVDRKQLMLLEVICDCCELAGNIHDKNGIGEDWAKANTTSANDLEINLADCDISKIDLPGMAESILMPGKKKGGKK